MWFKQTKKLKRVTVICKFNWLLEMTLERIRLEYIPQRQELLENIASFLFQRSSE